MRVRRVVERFCAIGHRCQQTFSADRAGIDCGFVKKATLDAEAQRRKTYYTSASVGIATGILITALHRAGLASLTQIPSRMKFLNKILRRADRERPFLLLVVGYPPVGLMAPDIDRLPLSEIATFI